jgi:hypothetical protein
MQEENPVTIVIPPSNIVIPAKAGSQATATSLALDSRFRWSDMKMIWRWCHSACFMVSVAMVHCTNGVPQIGRWLWPTKSLYRDDRVVP